MDERPQAVIDQEVGSAIHRLMDAIKLTNIPN